MRRIATRIVETANRIEFVKKEHLRLSEDPKRDAVRQYHNALRHDPSRKKIYLQWMLRQVRRGLYEEDLYKVGEDLQVFERHKRNTPVKDINRLKSYRDLDQMVEPFREQETEAELDKQEREEIRREIRTVYDGPAGKVLVPKTMRASCYIGRGTRWCTAATRGNNMFSEYTKSGPLYTIVPARAKYRGEKYQFHLTAVQLMDEGDNPIAPETILETSRLKPLWDAIQKDLPESYRLKAVGQNPDAFRYLDNPTDKETVAVLSKHPEAIRDMSDPSEKHQLYALESAHKIRTHPGMKVNIGNPVPATFRAILEAIKGMPSEKVVVKAAELDAHTLNYIPGAYASIPDSAIVAGIKQNPIVTSRFPWVTDRIRKSEKLQLEYVESFAKHAYDVGNADTVLDVLVHVIGLKYVKEKTLEKVVDLGFKSEVDKFRARRAEEAGMRKVETSAGPKRTRKLDGMTAKQWLRQASDRELERKVAEAKDAYYNSDKPIMSDADFDILFDALQDRVPDSPSLRTGTKANAKARLPFHMGSLDKLKTADELARFQAAWEPPSWVVSDKLDGVSFLYVSSKGRRRLYTRGDGRYGKNISAFLPYLDLPEPSGSIAVRGELIMPQAKFEATWAQHAANARNLVAGFANRKTIDASVGDTVALAYEILGSSRMTPEAQFARLRKLGFKTPAHMRTGTLDYEKLSTRLATRKAKSRYAIDGLVVSANVAARVPESGNPQHSRAFKRTLESDAAEVEVVKVEWRTTRTGRLAPRIEIPPTQMAGVVVRKVTGHNAAFIRDSGIGPGAVIRVVRSGDVIPAVVGVAKKTEPSMPDGQWRWEGVDAIAEDAATGERRGGRAREKAVNEIVHFFDTVGVDGVREGSAGKLYDAGYENAIDITRMPQDEMQSVLGDANGRNLSQRLDALFEKGARLDTLMDASNLFPGLGSTRLRNLLDEVPGALEMDDEQMAEAVGQVSGWGSANVGVLMRGVDAFIEWLEKIDLAYTVGGAAEGTLTGEVVLFTGFRDKSLAAEIEDAGGRVAGGFSAKVTIVVSPDGFSSTKVTQAKRAGVPILTVEDFRARYLEG